MITKAGDWQRPSINQDRTFASKVGDILKDIEQNGDTAVIRYSEKFDQTPAKEITLEPFDAYQLPEQLATAIKTAANRIATFARFQMEGQQSRTYSDDFGSYGQVVNPIERVGAYIPGGRFPLISTALMTLIPAKIAGCETRIACSPSTEPAILAAASLAGATRFFQIGGVQAIGALTYGFADFQPVDIIVGPGNAWVNEAKRQVQAKVKIDGLAGPSELLAICDNNQPIDWMALDALAQAEHDPDACSYIISDDANWLVSLLSHIESQEKTRPLLKNKQVELIYAETVDEIIQFSEDYAAEHLMLCHASISTEQLSNYGSLFIGANSAVALGDYISGPNHTLPTLGYAKQTGGLSVNSFLRVQTIQELNDKGRKALSEAAAPLAEAEGLEFHRQSLLIRQ